MTVSINYGVIDIQYSPKHQMYSTKSWAIAIKYIINMLITHGKNIKISDNPGNIFKRPTVCTDIINISNDEKYYSWKYCPTTNIGEFKNIDFNVLKQFDTKGEVLSENANASKYPFPEYMLSENETNGEIQIQRYKNL